ncbi:MAG: Transcriptional regulator [Thermococcales archaeon 44_46]|jgi:Lrp/AsnC family transcriptional regulator for asnA, asnC and gidA|uniref:Lrp/AsnC family transcriptional regulator n=1 Tax=Thermococcus TaxID=2263 RepID=UPI0005B28944|nr:MULTISPECIES: Lrp/AsnC family transcriptional regulator [Thermococcus]KUJ99331.1 MAG: Transcriptional regulator [Thermococcales archaeon 44_46]MDK2854257.1 Lrp/AsnC family transcriptional regulator, regulator for asnA, asnC and gidA [Thermococcaceae archaeon]MCA6213573.1 Lrp/AsnC family transcriptional regulator [Thermococcus bergensis]MPW39000.1 winged helix-turn-helix transcriptional regulator [Thermococcus sp. 101 C5]HIH72143.1 Lrp/AsnC family transcriptional regulator [Thermococcaceae a
MKLDEIDKSILRLLQEDGRMSYSEIARKIGVPESTVRLRVKKLMEEGIIRKFAALINPFKAGYSIVAFIAVDIEPNKVKRAVEELSKLPEVDVLGIATGAHDVLMQVTVKDLQELENFLIEKLGKIEGIKSTETSILTSVKKWGYARVF